MLFNSLSFLIFFPIVVCVYYAIPASRRIFFLLLASCVFYMAFVPKYILILFFLITVDYFLAQAMAGRIGQARKKFLLISVVANLGALFLFKYFNFFNDNISAIANFLHWHYSVKILAIAMPLGLSFHVFQSLSYIIEVYRGKYQPEKNYLNYALYVMFFPQLVAGPIERPQHLLPQFKIEHNFNYSNVIRGLERMMWGFFKKLVIADKLAIAVDYLYNVTPVDGLALFIMVVLFSYQLYCDFSGYSDIALGCALVLGYDLTENFNRPFAAVSIADFWRRWHISLSGWLRDYLYYPLVLGHGRISKTKLFFSLFITFVLIGLWHGANWTFVAFGAIHGFYQVIGSLTDKYRKNFYKFIRLEKFHRLRLFFCQITVFALVSLANVFFRANSVNQAWEIIINLGNGWRQIFNFNYLRYNLLTEKFIGITKIDLLIVISAVIFMEIIQFLQSKQGDFYIFKKSSRVVRYAWYYALIFAILFFGNLGAKSFIYFQF